MRVFSETNLLQLITARVTAQTSPCISSFGADNLITNLGNRGCSAEWNPLISKENLDYEADYNSCLKSDESLLEAHGHLFVLGLELELNSFVSRLLYVEGHLGFANEANLAGDDDETKYHLQNVRWYVGDSPNYWENDQCPDGPYMNRDGADTYYYDQRTEDRSNFNTFSKGIGYMHRGGLDVECNL